MIPAIIILAIIFALVLFIKSSLQGNDIENRIIELDNEYWERSQN